MAQWFRMNPKSRGFTLLELMIAVVVVAILATIAYPSYSTQVRKTARKEAIGLMLDMAGRMERIRSQHMSYQDIGDQATTRYALTVDVQDDGRSYLITATPSGDQQEDPCGVATLDQKGAWTFKKGAVTLPQDNCL